MYYLSPIKISLLCSTGSFYSVKIQSIKKEGSNSRPSRRGVRGEGREGGMTDPNLQERVVY